MGILNKLKRIFNKNDRTEVEVDNWKPAYESDYEGIEESFTGSSIPRTSQYYCDAYCSWQRGSNEVANRFIRRFLSKGTSFKGIKRTLVKKIQEFINTYPRKMFGYGNSDELFREKISFSI